MGSTNQMSMMQSANGGGLSAQMAAMMAGGGQRPSNLGGIQEVQGPPTQDVIIAHLNDFEAGEDGTWVVATDVNPQQIQKKDLLGSGGFADVFKCVFQGRICALKILRKGAESDETMEKFMKEVELMGKLKHSNCVRIYAYTRSPMSMIMEFCTNDCLEAVYAKNKNYYTVKLGVSSKKSGGAPLR